MGSVRSIGTHPLAGFTPLSPVEIHDLRIHLLLGRIGHLQTSIVILDSFQLRLERLHLAHRDNALVAQRRDGEIDQDRQDDDRPAPVPDVAMNPLECVQQRNREHPEHAEIDGLRELRVHRLQHVELLRADEEAQALQRFGGRIVCASS
jgi:hypothetical protein